MIRSTCTLLFLLGSLLMLLLIMTINHCFIFNWKLRRILTLSVLQLLPTPQCDCITMLIDLTFWIYFCVARHNALRMVVDGTGNLA